MAEDTQRQSPASKGAKGGSIFKKKVAGIPVPVLAVGGGIAVYLLYQHFHNASTASTSSVATPATSSGTSPGSSGGYTGGGGYTSGGGGGPSGGGGGPSGGGAPVNEPPITMTPPVPVPASGVPTGIKTTTTRKRSLIPIGKKTVTVGGTPFSTVSGFTQNGTTYYGVNNPTEAKKLEQKGVTLVHNPNDPTGKGLFIKQPSGSPSIPTHVPTMADKQPISTGHSGTGTDYVGTGATGRAAPAPASAAQIKAANQKAANERRAANIKAANVRRAANQKAANESQATKNAITAMHGR